MSIRRDLEILVNIAKRREVRDTSRNSSEACPRAMVSVQRSNLSRLVILVSYGASWDGTYTRDLLHSRDESSVTDNNHQCVHVDGELVATNCV